METTPDYHYRYNRFFLTSIGQWPYLSPIYKVSNLILTIFFIGSLGYLQIGGMITAWIDVPVFLESVPPTLIDLMCYVKLANFIYNADKMKKLLDLIYDDWNTFNDKKEREILNEWAENSKKNTIFYAGALYGSMAVFMLGPLLPMFMKLMPEGLLPLDANFTETKLLMFNVKYIVDTEKYYYSLLIHSYFGALGYLTVAVAIDSMFMVYVQHACAVFCIIGYRLKQLVDNDNVDINFYPSIQNDKSYHRIVECIVTHTKVLQYAQLIESANSLSFLFQLGLNMVCISFTGFQASTKLDRPEEAVRFASFTVTQLFHLFFESWPSQRLADESIRISEYLTESHWYLTSIKSRKLLQIFILKTTQPCVLTAGSLYILNLENFSAVVRTSMSYFTVLCSMQ
ncbi:odorant receptor 9a-like [Chelonus insularis]|uniref:odorant receptor 9a-like n=1 Tax=Chelonus insularis TaxID=460826 RepID=UPI0015898052|nr:odorant receptor 9a-like [Chelonus insularis]